MARFWFFHKKINIFLKGDAAILVQKSSETCSVYFLNCFGMCPHLKIINIGIKNMNFTISWFIAIAFYIYSSDLKGISKNRSLDTRKKIHKNVNYFFWLVISWTGIPDIWAQPSWIYGSAPLIARTDGLWAARSPSSVNIFW